MFVETLDERVDLEGAERSLLKLTYLSIAERNFM